MSISKLFQNFARAGDDTCQQQFRDFSEATQSAIYQKLLFNAGEGNKSALTILTKLKDADFKNKLGIHIERQRYAVAKANALYQDYLYQSALTKAAATKAEELLFDPQGRLVYELKLTPEKQEEVLKKIEGVLGKPNVNGRDHQAIKEELKTLLGGRTPTDTTLCSIDLTGKEPPKEGREAYIKIKSFYEAHYGAHEIPSHQRASIIASFEETYAHMCLMARTYEQRSRSEGFDAEGAQVSPIKWQEIRQKAAFKIQGKIASLYKDAVAKATDPEKGIDVEKLNKLLGKERKALTQFAKEALIEEVVAHLKSPVADRGRVLNYLQNLCKRLDKKHTFTAQTATGYDYFYTSDYLQQGMLITGTKDTAHDKPRFAIEKGEHQAAFRRVSYTYRDNNGTLQATTAVSARVPSPALVFNENMRPAKIKEDLHAKYGFLHEQMCAMRGGKSGPVVENLFTSFNSYAYERTIDWKSNRQRTTVLYMMQAMHEFNAQQFQEQPKANNFIYVQNIGTNRHTRDLGYRVDRTFGSLMGSVALDDITLSAEMAMLHTLQENSAYLSPKISEEIYTFNKTVRAHYRHYLKQKDRPEYFADSKAGESLIYKIGDFKEKLGRQLDRELRGQKNSPNDLPLLATNALIKMMTSNHHWDIRYGQLSQSLSMYLEWASTGGCKSGNERNQDVMLRFALLKSIHERVEHNNGRINALQKHEQEIYRQLKAYAKGYAADPDALRAAISISVSKCNMHGGAAAISREDQGGAAKISSFSFVQDIKNPYLRWALRTTVTLVTIVPVLIASIFSSAPWKWYASQVYDTNNAADREMHLDAFGASKTQAHKGQDEVTRTAVMEVLNRDALFTDKKLSEDEISGLNMDEKLCNDLSDPSLRPIKLVPSSFGQLSVGGAGSGELDDREKEDQRLAAVDENLRTDRSSSEIEGLSLGSVVKTIDEPQSVLVSTCQ